MKLFTLLSKHQDLKIIDGFLQSISGLELLIEFCRSKFEIKLFEQYNNNAITPNDCWKKFLNAYKLFVTPEAKHVILNAKQYKIRITPIGSTISLLNSSDYITQANKDILTNIIKLLPETEAGLLIGYKHKQILDQIPREIIIYNKPARIRAT